MNRDMKLSSYTSASNDDKDKTDEKEEKGEKKEGAPAESKGGGHSVPGGAPPDPELVAIQQKVMENYFSKSLNVSFVPVNMGGWKRPVCEVIPP